MYVGLGSIVVPTSLVGQALRTGEVLHLRPDSCNVNLYEDGSHAVGWHTDDEARGHSMPQPAEMHDAMNICRMVAHGL